VEKTPKKGKKKRPNKDKKGEGKRGGIQKIGKGKTGGLQTPQDKASEYSERRGGTKMRQRDEGKAHEGQG